MTDEVIIGTELLDYATELTAVMVSLSKAQQMAQEIVNKLADDEFYCGEAAEVLYTFANSLNAHLQRLIMLYQKGALYTTNTYETMYKSDEALAAWLIKNMGAGN